jgi:hypothetical protein
MAEAFARKAWTHQSGLYYYLGSRHALYNRMVDILWMGHSWNETHSEWTGGSYTPTGIRARFTSTMNQEMSLRFRLLRNLGRTIVSNQSWHVSDENRPWDWANLVAGNPDWFKGWINWSAPMLGKLNGPAMPGDKTQAIWYAWPRRRSAPTNRAQYLASDTLYIMTKAQVEGPLCGPYRKGCVQLSSDATRPSYIPNVP